MLEDLNKAAKKAGLHVAHAKKDGLYSLKDLGKVLWKGDDWHQVESFMNTWIDVLGSMRTPAPR